MNLIEKYLYALEKYLPKENREEIIKEVKANIYDMLEDDESEEHIRAVLKQLGNPRKLSLEYQTKKRYLIGPEYFNTYIKTLKYVIVIAGCSLFMITLFSNLITTNSEEMISSLGDIFGKAIQSLFEGAISAAIWVTIIFVAIENSDYTFNGKNVVKKTEWDPSMLKEVPVKKPKEYRNGNLITQSIFTLFFTFLFVFFAKYIGLYDKNGLVATLFIQERFIYYGIAFIIMAIYSVIININMIISKVPNFKIAAMKTIYTIISAVIGILFLFDNKLFNPDFKTAFTDFLNLTTNQYNTAWNSFRIFIIGLIIITSLIDTIKLFILSFKYNDYQKKS